MLKNYLKVAFRNLLRHKAQSAINILGLAIGLTCCLLITQYVAFEYNFDAFNSKAPEVYRVIQKLTRSGGQPESRALCGYGMGPALAEKVPEVVRFTRVHPEYDHAIIARIDQPDNAFEELRAYYADAAFLQMFDYPLVLGEPSDALSEPGTILLSESTAKKYFGDEDPIGTVLNYTGWIEGTFRVNGVFQDVPLNSHLQFDILVPMTSLIAMSDYKDPGSAWSWQNFNTYVQLRPDADIAAVESKFTDVLLENVGDQLKRMDILSSLVAQPLRDIHLNDAIFAPRIIQGSYRTVYFFALIGLITLIIALVNYVNLATARSLDRSREVGVRKVVGAARKQLILQFMFESALTNFTALVLAIALAELIKPFVNNLAGTSLVGWIWANPWFWIASFAVFLAGTLLAGLYPAFVLSSFRPVSVLKGRSGATSTRSRLRQGLVIVQFSASVGLLAGTLIVYSQLNFMRNMDLGLNLEQILTVRGPQVLPEGTERAQLTERLVHEFRQIPGILQLATSSVVPGEGFNWYSSHLRQENADPASSVNGALARIDTNFASLYGLQLIAGAGFKGLSLKTPEGEPRPVILNESAVNAVNFDSPEDAVQQLVSMGGATFRVVGVFKDFNWSSAHVQRESALFQLSSAEYAISMKVNTADLPKTIAAIEQTYKTFCPGNPFSYGFVDEKFDEQYQRDQHFATLFGVFASLAILIACLGLLGLAAFAARQRTKEIGIRKVLGCSVPGIVGLLSREFVALVIVANLIALPLAYYLMSDWLQGFAFRIEIGWWVFAVAAILTLLTALLTVSIQAIKAALANPVESLRYE